MTIHDSGLTGHGPGHVEPSLSAISRYVQDPIAIVGMACRLPGDSNSPHKLWEFLERGGVAQNEAPASRFNLEAHHDGSKKPKTMRSPGGMFLENVNPQVFDAAFFGVSRTDAIAMDPQQRQLLEVVYECLENTGLRMDDLDGAAVACFVGSYAVDYSDMQARDPEDRAPSITVGVGRAILSNRISHFLNIKGPSMTIDTACSGSLVSVDVACRYLQAREINGAIIAAANLYLNPEHNMDGGAMKGASSLSGKCHTFDVKADGYIKAEGINAIILKRLDDAVRDGDPIRAIIRGSATNSDGRTPGIASPSSEAQAAAIRAAYAHAGISDLNETTYLECHGTGTQAGDPTEVSGASSVFAEYRHQDGPLIIGSIKSNIGHSEPAAGISGVLKTVLAIENGIIPGNPTFVTPNPKIDFHTQRVRATRTAIAWPEAPFRRASVNSFGYGGSNAHVILEEPKMLTQEAPAAHVSSYLKNNSDFFSDDKSESTRPFTLVFSANDENSLQAHCKAIRKHLLNPSVRVSLDDLSYTLSDRRTHHFNRAYVVARNTSFSESDFVFGKKNTEAPRIGFAFTGQGAQWSQMAKDLCETFPVATLLLKHLDDVLQSIPKPPLWSLYNELVEPRSPGTLREPEFSQPLVTALQLAILGILEDWGISPQAVVGHSSGEIAAACAAGYLSREDAIKVAFYRGQAAKYCPIADRKPVGMLAVGLGPAEVSKYLHGMEDSVQIACFNSPQSVTLSGTLKALEEVKRILVGDHHFARLLQVDLAYHSRFMDEIGDFYEDLLLQDFEPLPFKNGDVIMFSSVTGQEMHQQSDASYWKRNMVSSVHFDEAIQKLVSGRKGANFLIEIGPSGALAGPIGQIKKSLSENGGKIQYCTALSRGQDSVDSLFKVAGQLFISGGRVNLRNVNKDGAGADTVCSKVIIDLPNYSWNHSTHYWYENEASKEWRNRLFPHHDLLGSKILGTSWHSPSWRKTLRVDDLPWLKDHKMGPEIVFPAAGFIAMAVEAISQRDEALHLLEGKNRFKQSCYKLRDLTFAKALVLEESKDQKIMLTLTPHPGPKDSWFDYKVLSLTEGAWNEHSRGLVRQEEDSKRMAPEDDLKPLNCSTPGSLWYKAMHDAGYNFGPLFQKHLEVESVSGQRHSRSITSLTEPESAYPQSSYPIHPACIDGCLQTCAPSLWKGNRARVSDVLVPAIIDEIIITTRTSLPATAICVTKSRYNGLGRQEETKNYISDASVYDQNSGNLLFQVSGLRYHKLDTREDPYAVHNYSRIIWKPDITWLSQDTLLKLSSKCLSGASANGEFAWSTVNDVIDLVAHKKPNLKAMEVNMVSGDSTSVWLDGSLSEKSFRVAARAFHFVSADAKALVDAQEIYSAHGNCAFALLDITRPVGDLQPSETDFDLVVVRMPSKSVAIVPSILQNIRTLLCDGGHLLLLEDNVSSDNSSGDESVVVDKKSCDDKPDSVGIFGLNGFDNTRYMCFEQSDKLRSVYLSIAKLKDSDSVSSTRHIDLVSLSDRKATIKLRKALEQLGWQVIEHVSPFEQVQAKNTVLILDDLYSPILPTIREDQWESIKNLISIGSRILWVTEGSQLDVTNPSKAMIHGLARTIRAEDSSVSLTTLDVQNTSGSATLVAIDSVLKSLGRPPPKKHIESEFVERDGILHVSRVQPDHLINRAEKEDVHGANVTVRFLHDVENCVRLRCDRLGTIDSLCYTEVAATELPVDDNCVEVELAAAGLNFKDVAITMGIVPEDQYLLGLEGAGVVRRVGRLAKDFKAGQRVLIFKKGTFANRSIATTERVHHIPDTMSFEEASTLPSVYLTAIYSIFDLANTKKGDRVLIHSASGGLGIASIQLCQYLGAEVFVTVGNDEKRTFLMDKFGIPSSNIFNSRSITFASELMQVTNGYGADVILNSLTGDLLEESWRCIAPGGTMVELGKKDMLDRNLLSMEPFGRNASYRCFDMSHEQVTDTVIGRLMTQMFDLLQNGNIKPIYPIKTFSFKDIPSAFRYMRSANHIGKIVISDGGNNDIKVPIRAAPRTLTFHSHKSTLIIGGLKGLCGSLAVYLARLGLKHLVVLSRSGYADKRSQGVLKDIYAEGCKVVLVKGDVCIADDVRRCFEQAIFPIGGIIQGAMVLRDKTFDSMSIEDYYGTITSKVHGTWNLHNIAQEKNLNLDFFTMLSSISGVVGQRGQANYAAANVFLDAFAIYRRKLGLRACSVDLGAIEDVGYMSEHKDLLVALDSATWTPINEGLFHKIIRFSIIQQVSPINEASAAQMITSIAVPQQEDSKLLVDARFTGLCFGSTGRQVSDSKDGSKEIQAFLLMVKSQADSLSILNAGIEIFKRQFMTTLRLSEPMEPAKPLSSYGLDSLAAVEFRNWVRMDLGAGLTTLEITNATSLVSLCEKIILKITPLTS